MHFKIIVIMMYASIINIESKVIEECQCSKIINIHGIGNCLPKSTPKICYLMYNTTCQDSMKSELYPRKKYSLKACKLKINVTPKSSESAAKNISRLTHYVLFQFVCSKLLELTLSQ